MIVGTAGHIDHGKTSLVRALTGVDTDRLKEEKARGISIELGFAYLPAPDGSVLGFIDVPGHEKFIHTMLAGATGIDFALLVVAADDGVMPQTREHMAIVELLGITHGAVALTKSDLVSAERCAEVATEIANFLAPTRLANAKIVPVSVVSGEGIDELRDMLFAASGAIGSRAAEGRFRLAVDRSFTLPGAGTVVTGTVLSGQVLVGDHVLISPSGRAARVRSIHAQNRSAERGVAGQRCALNLAGEGIGKDAIARGDGVLDPALHAPTDRIDATLRLLASEAKPITQWMPVRVHHASAEVGGRVVLLGDETITPGTEALAQLVLEQPIAAASGDRFVLRDTTAQRTIGGGTLLDLRAPSRKRRAPERIAQLEAHAVVDPEAALNALLGRAPFYVDLSVFARDRALSAAQSETIAQSLSLIRVVAGSSEFVIAPAIWLRFTRALLGTLEVFHADNPDLPGMGLERLRLVLEPRLPAPAFAAFLQSLVKAKQIGLDGAWVRLAGHEVKLTPEDEKIWHRVAPLISDDERFRPPRVRDIATGLDIREADIRRLMKLLGRMGAVDEVAQDHFFLRTTVGEMVGIIIEISSAAADGQFTAAQLRDRLDNGRKVAIQILEFFDRHGVTLRRGDLRRINRHRLDLFRRSDDDGRESSPVGRPDFKSGRGREPVLGGFDSLSSANFSTLPERWMTPSAYLDALKTAASDAAAAEEKFRRDILPRTHALERERAFAFRRLNFMNGIAEAVNSADSPEIAVAAATAVMRARLGWSSDSEARDEVIERFIPVALAMFAEVAPEPETPPVVLASTGGVADEKPDVATALSDFETWYEATHPNAFWVLFENVMPETPVVDFYTKTDFDIWLAKEFARTGEFTALVVLVAIQEVKVYPLCSTHLNVIGTEVDWADITVMFAGSGQDWQGAAFFPTVGPGGGPIDNPTARLRLRELEAAVNANRLVLNDGHFFDTWGRNLKIEEVQLQ